LIVSLSVTWIQIWELNKMMWLLFIPHHRRSLGAVDGAISRTLFDPIQSCKTFELKFKNVHFGIG
jgi:hypothetical protein